MKFVHISDIHLSDKLDFDSSNSKLIRKIKWDSFEKILKKNKDKDFLLISGDLFERDFFSLKDYKKLFEIFENFSKDIYYLCGNHDYIDSKNEIFFSDKPKNLQVISLNFLKIRILEFMVFLIGIGFLIKNLPTI